MSDDRVRLHVKASVVLVSSLIFIFIFILYRRCVLAPTINESTDSRSTSIAQIYLDFF